MVADTSLLTANAIGTLWCATVLKDDFTAYPGLRGAYPLSDGIETLVARVVPARAAEKSLDLQFYIWHADIAGRILLKELLDAADRGVCVHLLLDDLGVGDADDEEFLLLVSLMDRFKSRQDRTLIGAILEHLT